MKQLIKKFAADMQVRVGYGTAFLLLLMSYILTLYANDELLRQARLVDHTNKIILHLETMLSSITDAETGYRGYVITKDPNLLEPYKKSKAISDSMFSLVREETMDNPLKQARLDTLNQIIDRKFNLISSTIEFYPKSGYQINDSLRSKAYSSKGLMDSIRLTVSRMQADEQSLLRQRSAEMSSRSKALNVIIVVSLALALFLALYGFITYSRENKARRKADESVFKYQERLKRQIEELNQANSELLKMRSIEKLAATGRVARTIAHEIRNPLTNINLSVDQLRSDLGDGDKNALMMFDLIVRNSNRINQLIVDLLNSTKSTELIFHSVPVNRLLDETLVLAKDRIQLNNIQVEKYYSKDICDISVDIEKIKIAFLNIIVNAIESMEPVKGILLIKTANKNDKCFVTIADNGSGIDKESLSKLFEPYFTTKLKGTGLGLTNTHNIIVSHNGYVEVESEPGKGTVFTIILNFTKKLSPLLHDDSH